jgi:hypothetical protein
MSFQQWTSILERRRPMNHAILTTLSIAEDEANLSETSSSSCSGSKEDDKMMLVDLTDNLLQHTARIVADIEGGTEDCTI